MSVEFNTWKKRLADFSNQTDGVIKITKNSGIGYGADFITATISYPNAIVISQNAINANNEAEISYLILETPYQKGSLNISINQRDLFDKFFGSKRIYSGDKDFDRKYTIKSSDSRLALSIFKEERVQKLFLENPLLVFIVLTENNETIIRMKNMAKKLYTKEEMLYYLEEFKLIVSKL